MTAKKKDFEDAPATGGATLEEHDPFNMNGVDEHVSADSETPAATAPPIGFKLKNLLEVPLFVLGKALQPGDELTVSAAVAMDFQRSDAHGHDFEIIQV